MSESAASFCDDLQSGHKGPEKVPRWTPARVGMLAVALIFAMVIGGAAVTSLARFARSATVPGPNTYGEAARVLLYAKISAHHKAYESYDSEDEVKGGKYLKESEVKEILRAACADQPLLDRITLIMIEGLANIVAWKVLENGDDIRTVISENEGDLTEFVPKQMYQHVRQRVEELAKKVISEEKARMEAREDDSISPGASTPPKPWPDEAFEKESLLNELKQARGEKWVEEHRVMLDAQWEDLKSLLMG